MRSYELNRKKSFNVLKKYEKDYKVRLNELEENFIKFICTKLANGKRKIELETLKDLINDQEYTNDLSQTNVLNIFTNEFPTGSGKNTFKDCIFIEDTKTSKPFKTCLENNEFKSMVKEIIEYALDQYNKHYKNTYKDTNFVLYQKYTYEDACRLLNWQHNEVPLNIADTNMIKQPKHSLSLSIMTRQTTFKIPSNMKIILSMKVN